MLDSVVISGRSMEVLLNESVQRKIQFGNSSVPVWKSSKAIGQAHAALKERSPKNYPADSYSVKGNDNKSRKFKGPVKTLKELKVGNIRFLAIYQSGKGKEAHFVHCIHDSIGCVFVDEDKALYTDIKHFIPGYKPFNQQKFQRVFLKEKKKGEVESEGEDNDVPSKKKKKSRGAQNKKEESPTDEEDEESELSDYEGTSKMMMKKK